MPERDRIETSEAALPDTRPRPKRPRIRFDRNEFAGSFGDIGTDLPLIVAMISAASLNPASVFIVFGCMQILSGLFYGLPMPMQPLKAMAVLVITNELQGELLYGAGLAIGVLMLVLTLSGLLNWLARVVPVCVVRGIQMGLGLQLARLALERYVPSAGAPGYALAAAAFVVGVVLLGNRRFPAALPVIGLGVVYAFTFDIDPRVVAAGVGIALPELHIPSAANIGAGLVVLALPQLPLSLSNSVIATNTTLTDLFPGRPAGIRKIGLTYSVANLVVPFFSGIPVCHGCGGLAGHYAFGARTGGSVLIYGSIFVIIGTFFSGITDHVIQIFPQPVLGILLLFEAVTLMLFIRDAAQVRRDMLIALLTATAALTLPQGFIIGLVAGTILYYIPLKYGAASA